VQKHVYITSEVCRKAKINHVVVSPGSRSAPLTLAFASDVHFTCHSAADERSAAYMALGMARQLQQPVVLICTSGTAALNYFPAIAEAFFQQVPLLILTADRPPELLHQQDGQMIVQKNVYGNHVLASFEMPCYAHGKENLKQTASIVTQAIFKANNPLRKGPVHINVPLTEPLYEPIKKRAAHVELPTLVYPKIKDAQISADIKKRWQNSSRILVLAGSMEPDTVLFTALRELGKLPQVVVLTDLLSNQHATATVNCFDFLLSHASKDLLHNLRPDFIISFGGPVLSKALKLWLQEQKPRTHIRIQTHEPTVNTYQNVTHTIFTKAPTYLLALSKIAGAKKVNTIWKNLWQQTAEISLIHINRFVNNDKNNELGITHTILQHLPDAIDLHMANSSVIRYVSLLGTYQQSWIMHGNRGTSGIDGCSSTAVGAAMVNNRPTVLITGDLAFLYDSHAWWIDEIPDNIRVVVINNGGGGIFSLIPGPHINKKQTRFFTTPHKQNIEQITLQYGMEYYFCRDLSSLEQMLNRFFDPRGKAAVLEIKTSMKDNAKAFEAFRKIKLP